MYGSRTVANRFLDLARSKHQTLTPMQLLKLVYIAHGWCLALLGRPLIRDRVEAWQFGPVIPSLYSDVRQFKSSPVDGPLSNHDDEILDEEDVNIVDQTFQIYGELSGPALSRLTHQPGSPWSKTYSEGSFGLIISDDLIQDHYAQKAARDTE